MKTSSIPLSSLVEIGPEVVWLQSDTDAPAIAFFRAPTGEVKTRVLDPLDLAFLECLDGHKSKAKIHTALGISAEHFDALFQSFVTWAPQTLGLRNPDPDIALKRHKSLTAAAELRDIWTALSAQEKANATFHQTGIDDAHSQFDTVETTISHAYRVPTTALANRSYGEAFCDWLLQQGWLKPNARILEVGCGLGYFAEAVLSTLADKRSDIYDTLSYTMFDLSPALAVSQRETCAAHQDKIRALHGNIEAHDFEGEQFDLVVSNEVIADLSVARLSVPEVRTKTPTTDAARVAITYDLVLPSTVQGANASALINLGAIRFLETLAQCFAKDGKAILTEYGTVDRSPKAVRFLNHLEFTVQFGHLKQVAQHLGFDTDLQTLGDMLAFDARYAPLDIASFHVLSDAVLPYLAKAPLPLLAYTSGMLDAAIGPEYGRIRNLSFRPLTDPQCFSPFRFWALALQK